MRASLAVVGASVAAFVASALAESITEINGNRFVSSYRDRTVSNVTGLVTAKGRDGVWIRSTSSDGDATTSDSIYVFDRSVGSNLTVGDIIVLGGRVVEFRSSPDHLFLTEITSPQGVTILSSGNEVEPVVIGKDTSDPPTEQYSSLDEGDVFGLPNNSSRVSVENPQLQPDQYGLDFWESLVGELVTVEKPRAISRPNNFRDTWIVGRWPTTGQNSRGGLTMTDRGKAICRCHLSAPRQECADVALDANPEAILIGTPLDGTRNPTETKLGDELEEITGILTYAFGFYRILPLTAIRIAGSAKPDLPPPTKLSASGDCSGLTFGVYNVENLQPSSSHLPRVAEHIVNYLGTPTFMFLQEVQDNNGPTNDNSMFLYK